MKTVNGNQTVELLEDGKSEFVSLSTLVKDALTTFLRGVPCFTEAEPITLYRMERHGDQC